MARVRGEADGPGSPSNVRRGLIQNRHGHSTHATASVIACCADWFSLEDTVKAPGVINTVFCPARSFFISRSTFAYSIPRIDTCLGALSPEPYPIYQGSAEDQWQEKQANTPSAEET